MVSGEDVQSVLDGARAGQTVRLLAGEHVGPLVLDGVALQLTGDPGATLRSGDPTRPVVTISLPLGGGVTVLEDLSISGSGLSGDLSTVPAAGGGVHVASGLAVLRGCTIHDCVAVDGGGVAVGSLAGLVLESSVLFDNVALVSGGGAFVSPGGDLSLVGAPICGNAPEQLFGDRSVDGASCVTDACIDADENGIPDGCEGVPCPSDLDGDRTVDATDLAELLSSWGTAGGASDLDGDGVVGASDLAVLLGSWGACPE